MAGVDDTSSRSGTRQVRPHPSHRPARRDRTSRSYPSRGTGLLEHEIDYRSEGAPVGPAARSPAPGGPAVGPGTLAQKRQIERSGAAIAVERRSPRSSSRGVPVVVTEPRDSAGREEPQDPRGGRDSITQISERRVDRRRSRPPVEVHDHEHDEDHDDRDDDAAGGDLRDLSLLDRLASPPPGAACPASASSSLLTRTSCASGRAYPPPPVGVRVRPRCISTGEPLLRGRALVAAALAGGRALVPAGAPSRRRLSSETNRAAGRRPIGFLGGVTELGSIWASAGAAAALASRRAADGGRRCAAARAMWPPGRA